MTEQEQLENALSCYAERYGWDTTLDLIVDAISSEARHAKDMIDEGTRVDHYSPSLERLERNLVKLRSIRLE